MSHEQQGDLHRVHSLTVPPEANAVHGRVMWEPHHSLWNGGMMLAALVLGVLYFSLGALATALAIGAVTLCAGHSVGFHRRLIHRSFQCGKATERMLVLLGAAVGMGGPFWTIRTHDTRDWAQRQPECHDFFAHRYGVLRDLWGNLHCRMHLDSPPVFNPGPGIADDPFYQALDRCWMLLQVPIGLALYAGGGMPYLVWGVFVRVTACTTMHWYITRFAHTDGPQTWLVDGAAVQAHDVPWLAIPTMGEAWHNNHHAFPGSARHGLYPGQIDIGYRFVQVLQRLGLAWDVQLPETLPQRKGLSRAV